MSASTIASVVRQRALNAHLLNHQQSVTTAELRALGFDSRAVGRLLESGQLSDAHRGVYHCGAVPLAGDTALRCALLVAGDGSALTGQTGSFVLGHLTYEPRLIQTVIEGDPGRMKRRGVEIRRVKDLPESDITEVRGLRCTTPERTLLEFAGSIGSARSNPRWEFDQRALRRALREATVLDHDLPERLAERVSTRKRYRGSRILRLLLEEHVRSPGVLRSNFEAEFFAWCAEIGLPAWETNVMLEGFERDVVWRKERVVVELDTYLHHGDRRGFERDRERDNALAAAGYLVLRITDTRFFSQRAAVKDELFAALGLA